MKTYCVILYVISGKSLPKMENAPVGQIEALFALGALFLEIFTTKEIISNIR